MSDFTITDRIVREIGGGISCLLLLFLTGIFCCYIIRMMRQGDRDLTVLAAGAMSLITGGAALRLFLSWMQFIWTNSGWDASFWTSTWPQYVISVVMTVTGTATAIWLFSPLKWKRQLTVTAVMLSFIIPVAIFMLA